MSTLVNYASSDEEDSENRSAVDRAPECTTQPNANLSNSDPRLNESSINRRTILTSGKSEDGPLVGPSLGPMKEIGLESLEDPTFRPLSPYSNDRALLRNLTLSTLPAYEMPPSPPGSPEETTNAKFKHFLDLKKQGIHFNQKLARSSVLKNPGLTQKLMEFSGIDENGQYSTSLPQEFWDPDAFPAYAFKEELAKTQQKILKKKEHERTRGQRESVEFVPGKCEPSGRLTIPGIANKTLQKTGSAAERIMAGLDRGASNSRTQGIKRKTRFDA